MKKKLDVMISNLNKNLLNEDSGAKKLAIRIFVDVLDAATDRLHDEALERAIESGTVQYSDLLAEIKKIHTELKRTLTRM